MADSAGICGLGPYPVSVYNSGSFFSLGAKIFMSLTRSDVENIAKLARLSVSEAEKDAYAASLSRIFDMVAELNAVDVSQVEPMAHPLSGQVQRLRVDEVTAADERDKFQRNAGKVEAGLYLVPKVIE